MRAFYNEIEPYAAQWLGNLARAGHIAQGNVDERSIRDVQPGDLEGYTQAHFFAGIGVWSYALRLAGVPDGFPVWTGSCPCQPFSAAGRKRGFDDDRHLWPEWFRLIRERRPPVVFGEQVEGKDGRAWLDLVSADLEGIGYAFGAAVLPAAGVGAPHLRHRTFFVAHALSTGRSEGWPGTGGGQVARGGVAGGVAYADSWKRHGVAGGEGCKRHREAAGRIEGNREPQCGCEVGGVGNAGRNGAGRDSRAVPGTEAASSGERVHHRPVGDAPVASGAVGGFWADAEWLPCRDGKWRPVEPGTFPLAHGTPGRVGRLRAYGNAINAEVAATFIRASLEALTPGLYDDKEVA